MVTTDELQVCRAVPDFLCGVSEWREDDGVAESFELTDGAGFGFGGFAQAVVVGSEFAKNAPLVSMFHAVMMRACSTATSAHSARAGT